MNDDQINGKHTGNLAESTFIIQVLILLSQLCIIGPPYPTNRDYFKYSLCCWILKCPFMTLNCRGTLKKTLHLLFFLDLLYISLPTYFLLLASSLISPLLTSLSFITSSFPFHPLHPSPLFQKHFLNLF